MGEPRRLTACGVARLCCFPPALTGSRILTLDRDSSQVVCAIKQRWSTRPFAFSAALDVSLGIAMVNLTAAAHLAANPNQRSPRGQLMLRGLRGQR